MSVDIRGDGNNVRLSAIRSDPKLGTWWAFGTDKQWVVIRTTKAGKIKVGTPERGTHPYFTPAQEKEK